MQSEPIGEVRQDILTRGSRVVAALAIILIMVGTVIDVILRSFVRGGIPGVVEVSEILLAAAVFLGLAAAHADGRNVTMSIVVDRVGPATRRVFDSLAALISLAFVTWLAWANVERAIVAIVSGEFRFGLVAVPLWPGRVAVALGCALLCVQLVREAVRVLRGARQAPAASDLKGGI